MKDYKIKMLSTTLLTISCKYLNCISLVLYLLLTLSSGTRRSLHWVLNVFMNSLEVKFTDWDISITVRILEQMNRNTLFKLCFL